MAVHARILGVILQCLSFQEIITPTGRFEPRPMDLKWRFPKLCSCIARFTLGRYDIVCVTSDTFTLVNNELDKCCNLYILWEYPL